MEQVSPLALFHLRPITAELAEAMSEAWWPQIEDLGEDDVRLVSKYQRLIAWAEDYGEGVTKGEHLYGIVGAGESHPKALVELVHARAKSNTPYLKFLNMHFEPRLDTLDVGGDGFSEVIGTISAAIVHSIGLIFSDLPSYQLKVYGRGDEMKSVCDAIKYVINREDTPAPFLEADSHGRWLTVTKTQD